MSDTIVPEGAASGSWMPSTTWCIVLFVGWLVQVVFLNKHINKISSIKPKNEEDVKRDEKYSCFRQPDVNIDNIFSRIAIWIFCVPLIFTRLAIGIPVLAILQLWCFLVFLIIPPSNPYHKTILLFGTKIAGYALVSLCSVLWVSKERPKVCYKKYLGKDWTPKYEGQGTTIFNHSAWVDTLTMMTEFTPCFVAKASVRNLPLVGYTAWRCGSLFIDRVDKDSRAAMYKSIADHQEAAEKGEKPPLAIAPEGGTTNGTAIIQFKKGAFASLRSIKPYGLHYSSMNVPVQSGVIPFESHLILLLGNVAATCHMKELPVFTPNEFFWKNHMKEGEEKVDAYMRVMRELMAENLGQDVAEIDIKEKFDYRNLIWPSKKKGE